MDYALRNCEKRENSEAVGSSSKLLVPSHRHAERRDTYKVCHFSGSFNPLPITINGVPWGACLAITRPVSIAKTKDDKERGHRDRSDFPIY
jgi:hypothetical protein